MHELGRTYSKEQARKACPPGWMLPTRAVWSAVDTTDIFALLDTVCWANPEGHTNATGLALQPSGFKHKKAYWNHYLSSAIWFDDPDDPDSNWHLHVHGNNAEHTHYLHTHKEKINVRRFAVRCVRPAER
ncbi:MAG: FISUMP domain-containing protein [Flavobacteriales bacterium]